MLHKERRGQGRKRNTVSYPPCQPDGMWNHIKCSQRSLTKEGGLTLNVGSAIPQAGVSDWGQRREWVESQHSSLSASCLRMQCDLCSSCHGGWYPKTVSQNERFLPSVPLASYSVPVVRRGASLSYLTWAVTGCHQ